jgi:signal transduction histidine kinase
MGSETQKCKDLTSIRGAGHKLLELIDDLLDLSKLEAGKAGLSVEEFEFADFCEKLISASRPSIVEGGNQLIVKPLPAERIVCDSQKLRRVVENLLSNAAKFTRNGSITFSGSIRADSWIIAIEDTGAGIPEARMATLFETFGRSEDETASKYGDEVRLGLPLAYRYCQLMGGNLSVQSKLGLGSTVTVTLPRQSRIGEERTEARTEIQ